MLELAAILVLGIFAQWFAWKIKLPAIFPLILIGMLAGPVASLDIFWGSKLINPKGIFEGKILNYFVSLSVGIILFEGGLTLKLREVRHVASTVRNLVLIGSLISLLGGALAAHYIIGLDLNIAFLFGALIVVTGPTVIGPILRNVQPNKAVATILKWESIIIDPVGAFVAVLAYEFILSGATADFTLQALITFLRTVFAGSFMGILGALLLYYLLKRKLIPDYLINLSGLAMVFISFVGADLISSESGLLAVTVMGMTLANLKVPELLSILNFKETLTVLLISILFIILSANIEIAQLELLGWRSFLVLAAVVLVIRPAGVFLCTIGSNLTLKERLFISWIGPRGIVAAGIASIFSIRLLEVGGLSEAQYHDAQLLLPLTFLIIIGTVILQGGTAKRVAEWLGVTRQDAEGFLLLGAHEGARKIAAYLQSHGATVAMVDTSHTHINEARQLGLPVIEQNILSEDFSEDLSLLEAGYFMALTPNNELNIFACRRFKSEMGQRKTFRLVTEHEMKFSSLVRPKYILFDDSADYFKLTGLARNFGDVKELPLKNEAHFRHILATPHENVIPLFLRGKDNGFKLIQADHQVSFSDGDRLAYLGAEPGG